MDNLLRERYENNMYELFRMNSKNIEAFGRRDIMEPFVMRNMGRRVMVRDRMGRRRTGMIDGVVPGRGMFIRNRFRREFVPFFLIATLFLI